MRSWTTKLISLFLGSGAFVSLLWLSTAFLGQAKSQDTVPSNDPIAPEMNLPLGEGPAPTLAEDTEAGIPEIIPADGFLYDPKGRRDPFRPFGATSSKSNSTEPIPFPVNPLPGGAQNSPPSTDQGQLPFPEVPEQAELLEPLQSFDISQLRVVGIIWQVDNPKAMIQDPVGKLYLVKKNSKLGRNRGFVAVIREGEVVIVEPTVIEGMNTATTRVMSLIR
jgi:type IV pilus assembly protein PilP